jgi:hypothetical protein
MQSQEQQPSLAAVLQHSRNKFFDVFPSQPSLGLKVLRRIGAAQASARQWLLRRNGFSVVVSEQAVEVPFVMRQIRETDKSILDFGAFESTVPLQLAALGHEVTVWDQRPYPFRHSRIHVISDDILSDQATQNRAFDVVMSISTVEHIGLGNYGDISDHDGDKRAVSALWRLVRPGGRLIVTVPAGVGSVQRGYRIYDQARLREVFPFASAMHFFQKQGRAAEWNRVSAEEATSHTYADRYATMPVEAVAIAVCEKAA